MISFRYHVVSLVAVLLALAVGIALGGGPLQRAAADATRRAASPRRWRRRRRASPRRTRRWPSPTPIADGHRAGASSGAALTDRAVTLVDAAGRRGRRGRRAASRDGRPGRRRRRPPGCDVAADAARRRQPPAGRRARHPDGRRGRQGRSTVPPASSGYERMGRLLAHALGTAEAAGEPVRPRRREHPRRGRDRRACVTPAATCSAAAAWCSSWPGALGQRRPAFGRRQHPVRAARALDDGTDGVVVAGPLGRDRRRTARRRACGPMPWPRARVSTVDVADRAAGAVVAVLALARAGGREVGALRLRRGADGAVPAPTTGVTRRDVPRIDGVVPANPARSLLA